MFHWLRVAIYGWLGATLASLLIGLFYGVFPASFAGLKEYFLVPTPYLVGLFSVFVLGIYSSSRKQGLSSPRGALFIGAAIMLLMAGFARIIPH